MNPFCPFCGGPLEKITAEADGDSKRARDRLLREAAENRRDAPWIGIAMVYVAGDCLGCGLHFTWTEEATMSALVKVP